MLIQGVQVFQEARSRLKTLDKRRVALNKFLSESLNIRRYRTKFTRWRSWLRHCATSWKVPGSSPDGVI